MTDIYQLPLWLKCLYSQMPILLQANMCLHFPIILRVQSLQATLICFYIPLKGRYYFRCSLIYYIEGHALPTCYSRFQMVEWLCDFSRGLSLTPLYVWVPLTLSRFLTCTKPWYITLEYLIHNLTPLISSDKCIGSLSAHRQETVLTSSYSLLS